MKLIILDRDGVINHDSDAYIKSVEEWIPIEGSLEAIAQLKRLGYTVTVATNQSGIGRGYYNVATLDAMHAKMQSLLAEHNGQVDYIAYCPHVSADHCECRKPKAGMVLDILNHYGVTPEVVVLVGDSYRDWQAAHAAGIQYVQVRTGKGEKTIADGKLPTTIPIFADLASYVAKLG